MTEKNQEQIMTATQDPILMFTAAAERLRSTIRSSFEEMRNVMRDELKKELQKLKTEIHEACEEIIHKIYENDGVPIEESPIPQTTVPIQTPRSVLAPVETDCGKEILLPSIHSAPSKSIERVKTEIKQYSLKPSCDSLILDSQHVKLENEFSQHLVMGKISSRISPLDHREQLHGLRPIMVEDVIGLAFDGCIMDIQLFDPGILNCVHEYGGVMTPQTKKGGHEIMYMAREFQEGIIRVAVSLLNCGVGQNGRLKKACGITSLECLQNCFGRCPIFEDWKQLIVKEYKVTQTLSCVNETCLVSELCECVDDPFRKLKRTTRISQQRVAKCSRKKTKLRRCDEVQKDKYNFSRDQNKNLGGKWQHGRVCLCKPRCYWVKDMVNKFSGRDSVHKVLSSLHRFRCSYKYNFRLWIYCKGDSTRKTFTAILLQELASHEKELMSANVMIDGDLVLAFSELVVTELMYIKWPNPNRPIYIDCNFTGTSYFTATKTSRDDGETVVIESEGFMIYDSLTQLTSVDHKVCVGTATRQACLLLSVGNKGKRFMLLHAQVLIHHSRVPFSEKK